MKRKAVGCAALLAALLLSACGGGSSGPTYTLGDLEIPALPTEEEPKVDVYGVGDAYVRTYTEFTNVETILPDYVTMLTEEYGLQTVTKALMTCPAPMEYGPEGDIYLGAPTGEEGEKTLLLEILWNPEECSVVSSIIPGTITDTVNTVQVDTAQQYIEGLSPGDLGLSGASMDAYEVFAGDGGALVDGKQCMRFSVYQASGTENGSVYMGTYLISMDGQHLYQLDLDTNRVTKLADPNLSTGEEEGGEGTQADTEAEEQDDKKDKNEDKEADKKAQKDAKDAKDEKEAKAEQDDAGDAVSRMGAREE